MKHHVHYMPQPSSTSITEHDVCHMKSVTSFSSRIPCTTHSADNTLTCSTPKSVWDNVQSVMKECVQSRYSSEAYIPPVPVNQDVCFFTK